MSVLPRNFTFVYYLQVWEFNLNTVKSLRNREQWLNTILIIMAATSVLSYILSYEQIPKAITELITRSDISPIVFILAINLLLLALGLLFRDHICHIDCCTNIASNT